MRDSICLTCLNLLNKSVIADNYNDNYSNFFHKNNKNLFNQSNIKLYVNTYRFLINFYEKFTDTPGAARRGANVRAGGARRDKSEPTILGKFYII